MKNGVRTYLFGFTSSLALAGPGALAQTPPVHPRSGSQLEEIVVTAQKRSQRLQDVPIAVTAITPSTLQAKRITSAVDLNGVAPNVTVRQSGGSTNTPAFAIRGVVSYGVVPGSDKETSIYVDGVYLGTPEGSNFELADIERIEVLRGPQGTLFGRNATTGAISIVTRDPTGVLGGRQEFTVGNYNEFRTRTSVDLPRVGAFSGYLSYVHDQRNGDIRNLGAGQVWDRTGPNTGQGIEVSPKYLGSHDSNSYFGALKYAPTDWFKTIYKFDYSEDDYTPDGIAAVAVAPYLPGLLGSIGVAGNILLDPTARRPDVVNNSFSSGAYEKNYGHNLTSTLQVNDALSLKNILAYRYSLDYSNTQIEGLGGLTLFGQPFAAIGIQAQSENRQFSDELQANYVARWLTLTTGLLFFHQNTVSGGPPGLPQNYAFGFFPGGRLPLATSTSAPGGEATSYNHATSLAAYTQAEVHITHQIDLVGGLRITDDEKSGVFVHGGDFTPGLGGNYATGTFSNLEYASFRYRSTKPSYSMGVNYKPARDILIYGKYSDSFVSGGAIGGVGFKPETASSFEVGGKADFLDHRLRTNVSLFDVEYRNLQSAQSGLNVGHPELGTVIVDQGNANAKGVEIEINARPINAVTLGGSLGYTDVHYTAIPGTILGPFGGSYIPIFIPKFTATVLAEYQSGTIWRGSHLSARIDADWTSKEASEQRNDLALPGFEAAAFIPANWILNTRLALADIAVAGHTVEIAGWARNLANSRVPSYPLNLGGLALASTFVHARTYGLDLSFQF